MMKISLFVLAVCFSSVTLAQAVMTPEKLIQLNRVGGIGLSKDKSTVVYAVSKVDIKSNKKSTKMFQMNLDGSGNKEITDADAIVGNSAISPDGKYKVYSEEVKIDKVAGSDFYPEMKESNMMVYNSLNYRHWDTYEDGKFSHVFIEEIATGKKNRHHERSSL